MPLMRGILLILTSLSLLVFSVSCGPKKPNFIPDEDYSYLKKRNKILLVLRIRLDAIEDRAGFKRDKEIQDILENHNFQLRYRGRLARELFRWDKNKKLGLSFDEKAEEESLEFIKYIGRKYPKDIADKYDLILEIDSLVFLTFDLGYVNFSKRERLRLIDAKTGFNYLASMKNQTYKAIGQKIKLKRDIKRFRRILESLVNRSSRQVARYILRLEANPDEDDITPLLPKLKNKE